MKLLRFAIVIIVWAVADVILCGAISFPETSYFQKISYDILQMSEGVAILWSMGLISFKV